MLIYQQVDNTKSEYAVYKPNMPIIMDNYDKDLNRS